MSDKYDDDFEFDDEEKERYAGYPKNDFIFDIHGEKILFKNVAWHEPTKIRYLNLEDPRLSENKDLICTPDFLEFEFSSVPDFSKIKTSATYNSAEDFRFCLCYCGFEFSCINKPVITPLFDYDCLPEEKFKEQEELEEKYRLGLMPPEISYEFPVTIPYKGQDISCVVRFRDTSWYEIDRFTVELAKGEPAPEGWQKNEYGEYAFPNDDLWNARGFSKIFPAYDMQCSPHKMYLRLGKILPLNKDEVYIPPNVLA